MGHTHYKDFVHAEEAVMRQETLMYDQEPPPYAGHWFQKVTNEHTRIIVEYLGNKRYCTRSLVRSALMFETIEDLEGLNYWLGIIYEIEGENVTILGESTVIGDTAFRELYRSYGGVAKW